MGTAWRRRDSAVAFGKAIQQRRQHVIAKMKFKLLDCPEVFLARRTPGLHDLVLRAHKCIQIVALYFFSDSFQQLRLLHDPTPNSKAASGASLQCGDVDNPTLTL
jgi:hypothetical protein